MLQRFILLTLTLGLTACQTLAPSAPPTALPEPSWTPSLSPVPSATITLTETPSPTATFTLEPSITPTVTNTPLPVTLGLDPADWHNWPVQPIVTERTRLIYQIGQALGNDPHAFSVFGDCQSEPKVFLAPYDTDPVLVAALTPALQETVAWFAGSFNRDGPTIRGGTTTGALLWSLWHQNKYTCTSLETPLQCELRIHKPSFVIIHVGTHYENRDEDYMRSILDQLIAAGVVPILATKADDRELDERVNSAYARLVAEYEIPLWNFWAAVDDLPNRGLYTRTDAEYQGNLYLTEEARAIHRLTALQALDAVWRIVSAP